MAELLTLVLTCVYLSVIFGHPPGKDSTSITGSSLSFATYYGDHMVLQKEPAMSTIWGYSTNIGAIVTIVLGESTVLQSFKTRVEMGPEGKGVWKVLLHPVPAGGPYFITATDTKKNDIKINDVMFGDVWVCSGQSNMQFTLPMVFNASEEIEEAHLYTNIRLFTVDMKTADTPQYDFISIEESWSLPSKETVGNGNWTYFSAVCWLYGKYLARTLNYPIGLVASDWGGTTIETWSSSDALKKCGISTSSYKTSMSSNNNIESVPTAHSVLWNAMIHPLLNFTIYGVIWYQGESNAGNPIGYNCTFPAMIDDWRIKFNSASQQQTSSMFPFGFVQLASNRNDPNITTGFPGIRWSQTASIGYVPNTRMQHVFMAVAMDLPDFTSPFGSVHPRDKQTVANRLYWSGLSVAYGRNEKFQGPFPSDLQFNSQMSQLTITYDKGQTILHIRAYSGFEFCCSPSSDATVCDQPSLSNWYKSGDMSSTSTTVTLQIPTVSACSGNNIKAIRYAWRESPCSYKQCAVYSVENDLPGPPFKILLSS